MPQRGGGQGNGDHRTITICNEKPSPGVFRYRLHRWVSRDGRCARGRGPELSSPETRRSIDLRRLPRGWCPGPGSPHPRQDQRLPEGCDRPLRAMLRGQPPGDAQFVSTHPKKERERSGEGYILKYLSDDKDLENAFAPLCGSVLTLCSLSHHRSSP